MERYKLKSNFIVFTAIILLFIACGAKPTESQIELALDIQVAEKPFSLKDYCKEPYDSIFLLYPYFNTQRREFVNLKMSNDLRTVCENKVLLDSFSTLLFIHHGEVKAYSIIENRTLFFSPPEIPEDRFIFSIEQKFILDENRYLHLYNE